jgi:hypothetical protein
MKHLSTQSLFISLIVLIIVALNVVPAFAGVSSISGSMTAGDPTFNRRLSGQPCSGASGVGTNVFYDVAPFIVTANGSYTFTLDGTGYDAYLHIYQGSFNPLSAGTNCIAADDDSGGSLDSRITINLTAGIQYFAVMTTYSNGATGTYVLNTTSAAGTVIFGTPGDLPPFTDGRLNNRDQWATFAVYCDGSDISVYAIDSAGSGQVAFVATTDEVAAVPQFPPENTVIDSGRGITLYRVITGELQMVGVRDFEGKVYNLQFLGCPAQVGDVRTWVGF